MRSDFLFFARDRAWKIVADIVDPHGVHLADALIKLKGLARYAELHAASFRRIDAVAVLDGEYRVLDMKEKAVRGAVRVTASAQSLYESVVAREYVIKV